MAICRICLEPGELITVCDCSGTSKWVHKECIEKWYEIRSEKTCEICHGTYDISKFNVEEPIHTDDEEPIHTDDPVDPVTSDRVTRLGMWLAGVLSFSQSVVAWFSIQYNANPILDVLSMGFWFNTIHLVMWLGQLNRQKHPHVISAVWLLGSVFTFVFMQLFGDTFDSEASIFFLEINLLFSFSGILFGICVAPK